MPEQQKYRILFEFVNPISHPDAYYGERPRILASDVPEEWWQPVRRESYDLGDVQDQQRGILSQIAEGELIRNPRIEKATLTWEAL